MIKLAEKDKCTGCNACISACPQTALSMQDDREGFFYPCLDELKCIGCKICEKVCPIINHKEEMFDAKEAYVARAKDEHIREISSSGGIFSCLALEVLKKSGHIYACGLDEAFVARHIGISEEKDLHILVGSKYMQSRLDGIFNEIKSLLESNVQVLFCGTTCQVGGLKSFLGYDYQNLICIDFICLGVPSPKIWSEYLNIFFNKQTIEKINFKDKTFGWHHFSLRIDTKEKQFIKPGAKTYFFSGYFKGLYTRPCCSNCTYKRDRNRISDITLSDCWGSEHIAAELDDNRGLSSIVCHSEKGMSLFYSIKDKIVWKLSSLEDVTRFNRGYFESQKSNINREKFWQDWFNISHKTAFKKWCKPQTTNILIRLFNKIRRIALHKSLSGDKR